MWTEECSITFEDLKSYLQSPPLLTTPVDGKDLYLYLSVSANSISTVLVCQYGLEQQPIYYTSRTLTDAEMRYLQLEKLVLTLVIVSRKLVQYFQSHVIIVLIEHPIKTLLRRADLSNRISKWAVELANFHIEYQPKTTINGQALANFIVEFPPVVDKNGARLSHSKDEPSFLTIEPWRLLVGNT